MKLRLLTALAGIPIVLGAVFCAKPWPFIVILLGVLSLALYELHQLYPVERFSWTRVPAALIALGLSISVVQDAPLFIPAFILSLFAAFALRRFRDFVMFSCACLWICVPIAALFSIWSMNSQDKTLWDFSNRLLMVLFPIWAGDSAGIFVGKYFGKHLLAPKISPKKTWEGAIANFSFCILLAALAGYGIGLSPLLSISCGVACGIFGQVGDLFESALKRSVGVKDSGTILPGHGGILDRIDSLLFAAPVVLVLLLAFS